MGRQTILLVQFLDFESELPFLHDFVVEFMPSADGCVFGPGEIGERVKVEAVDGETQGVK